MLVAQPIIAGAAFLGQLIHQLWGDPLFTVRHLGSKVAVFHRAQGLAHITAAPLCQGASHAVRQLCRGAVLLLQQTEAPLHRGHHICRGDGFELKHRAPAEHCRINIKIRVLRGAGDQGDLAVFYVFQQGLLLAFVKILDLVQIQQYAVGRG